MKNPSIKQKILFLAMFPAFIIATLLSALVLIGGVSEIDGALNARGLIMVRQLAPASEYGAFSGNHPILQALAQAAMKENDVKSVVIADARNKILAVSGRPPRLAVGQTAATGADGVEAERILAGEKDSLIFSAPIYQNEGIELDDYGLMDRQVKNDGKKKMLGRVFVELSTASTQHRKNHFILASMAIGLFGLAGALLLARRMSHDVTRPLSRLLDAVTKMTYGHLDTRVAADSGGELAALENGFNHMAAKLQAAHSDMQARVDEATAMLAQKEQAERANSAKTRFLAAASHDLRQPVQALNWFVGALHQLLSDAQALHICQLMRESIKSLNELLETLLDISKLDAGVIAVEKEAVPVNLILTRLDNEFRALLEAKGIEFSVHPCAAWVETDPNLLAMALRNLLANAAKYTDRGKIVFGCRRRGKLLALQIWDSGVGIPAAELKNIFQEFYQVGEQAREKRQGLGLGLAIVERVVKLLGHTLNVHSRVGRGSLFEVLLPLSAAGAACPPNAEIVAITENHVLVAVIEDEPDILEGIKYLLSGFGYQVAGATSAAALLDDLGQSRETPDIIIADYRLGENTTGHDAICLIRDTFSSAIPAIMITGDTTPERLREADSSHIKLLHKPIDADKLLFTIEKALVSRTHKPS